MAREPFLINPPKRVRRKSTKKRSNPKRSVKKRRNSVRRKKNPYGQEVVVVGRNPKRRKRRATRKRKRTYKRRRNPVAVAPKRRRRRRSNPVARKVTRRRVRRNYPVARRRKRRNPAMTFGGMNLRKPMTLIMPVGVGVASLMATKAAPNMLNLTGNMRYLAQVGVAVAGGMILKKPLGAQNAAVWAIVSLVSTASEVLRDKVGGVFSGMGAFVDFERGYPIPGADNMMGEYATSDNYGAFVDEGPYETGEYESGGVY